MGAINNMSITNTNDYNKWILPKTNDGLHAVSSTGSIKVADVGVYYNNYWGTFFHVISPNDALYLDDFSVDLGHELSVIEASFSRNNLLKRQTMDKFLEDHAEREAKEYNIKHLFELEHEQEEDDEDYVSHKVFENTLEIVFNAIRQPEIFKTYENSMNLQYELKDRSYLEFEVFENRITCMIVPKRLYDDAFFPEVEMLDMNRINCSRINEIIGDFYEIA